MNFNSEFNPTVKDNNNVRIVDPNPIGQTVPHEDMFIYASLKALQKTKSVITTTENGGYSLEPQVNRNTIELIAPQKSETVDGTQLFKTKENLTTSWTEIGGPLKSVGQDFEGFGITNIDIEIKSQTTPIINIDFVDVRGATLFEQGSCSPYGLFFNLPYPIFHLTLKGYYGRPVKYYLNLMSFTCKFNSSNGNMECRGKFIGYTFAFLSDMIMGYVMASQYLDKDEYQPQDKLRKKYAATKRNYKEQGLKVEDPEGEPTPWCDNPKINPNGCTTILDLINLIEKFEKEPKQNIINSPEFFKLSKLQEVKTQLKNYQSNINELIKDLEKEGINKNNYLEIIVDPEQYYNFGDSRIKSIIDILLKYFDKSTGSFLNQIKEIFKIDLGPNDSADNYISLLSEGFDKKYIESIEQNEKPKYEKLYSSLDKTELEFQYGFLVNNGYKNSTKKQKENNVLFYINIKILLDNVVEEIKKIEEKISELQKTVNTEINKIFTDTIGFKPSIRNIFTVILCNTDAFIDILLDLQIKAENYHNEKTGLDTNLFNSGSNKIYPWPTYFQNDYTPPKGSSTPQGQKEVYPGKNFPDWYECKFVEDFLKAYVKFQKEVEISTGNVEGKPGFDNYLPINPLESPIWDNNNNPIKYYDVYDQTQIYKIIGERAFVNLDHTYFSPIRLTPDILDMPLRISNNNKNLQWNGIKNTDIKNEDIPAILGAMDAWNFLTSKDGENKNKVLYKGFLGKTKQEFIENVLKTFEKNLIEEKAVNLSGLKYFNTGKTLDESYGFNWTDEYYVLTPEDGIKFNGDKVIYADPHKMDPNNLLQIILYEGGNEPPNRQIKITSSKLLGQIDNYLTNLNKKTSSLSFETYELTEAEGYPKNINNIFLKANPKDTGWFVNTLSYPQHFITLAMSSADKGKLTDWYKDSQITSLSESNMGLLSYWDYDYNNETSGISFLTEENSQTDIFKLNVKTTIKLGDDEVDLKDATDDEGISTPLITTPLWLDNVNDFRKKSGGKILKINSNGDLDSNDKFQYRNLAYLFLHTIKTTPLISRFLGDDGYLLKLGVDLPSKDKQKGTYSGPSLIQSLRPFMISGGMAQVPKAWLLTLGAQLWRWKMFVGTKSDGSWNKPLTCQKCNKGDTPTGFDPLAQPGFNYNPTNNVYNDRIGLPFSIGPERNNIPKYLEKIYGITNTTFYTDNIQTSVFSNEYQSRVKGQKLVGPSNVYASFRYYNIYRNEINFDGVDQNNLLFASPLNEVKSYSWPQLWISPHHIPYVNPEIFYDNEDGSSSGFVAIFENTIDYLDYQTIMPVTYDNKSYNDGKNLTSLDTPTQRNRKYDGNLGMVFQYIPDGVKDKIIEEFEKWCDDEWKNTILPIVDPVNFSQVTSDKLFSRYELSKDISKDILDNNNNGYALALQESDDLKKLLTDQYWVISSTPKIWYGIGDDTQTGTQSDSNKFVNSFLVSKTILETYLNSFYDTFTGAVDERIKEIDKAETEKNSENDSILDDDDIRLSLYRTFKSISDKWISASEKGKPFFNMINEEGKCSANYQYDGKTSNDRTIANNFQYVNRAMGDIGDEAIIDIMKLKDIRDNPKLSLYQYLTDLLTQNEYLFFPLPAYVNFSHVGLDEEVLKDMFKPVNNFDNIGCGPIFLSMYVGGGSRQLNLSTFKTNCNIDQQTLNNINDDSFSLTQFNLPSEFNNNNKNDNNTKTTAFEVLYGIENQNHFKNIQLDQSEFKETAESLMVIEKLSQQGGNDRTSKGQNLNAAYLTRSYTCEIESYGNMMIQPMTYFDLKGVPMFSGSYLITEVRHNFKPNNATTTFKGVRQPRMTLPIVTDVSAAMSYLFKDAKSTGTGRSISKLSPTKSPNGFELYPPIPKNITELFVNPVDCKNQPKINSPIYRKSNGDYHGGIDIGFDKPDKGNSANVYAAYDGVVQFFGAADGYGKPPNGGWIVIRHGKNKGADTFDDDYYYHFVYGHVNPESKIKEGYTVSKGELIGKAVHPTNFGSKSSGLHLHLTVLRLQEKQYKCKSPDGRDCVGKIDPSPFLNQNSDCIKGVLTPTYGNENDSGLIVNNNSGQKGTKSDKQTNIKSVAVRLGYIGKV